MEGMINFMDNISLKVDEAGRIIIPLKVRKKYGIGKNDTLLLTTVPNGFKLEKEDIFTKYEKIFTRIKLIEETIDVNFIITDNEKIIYTSDVYTDLKSLKISNKIKQILNDDLSGYSKKIDITKNFTLNLSCYYTVLKLDNYINCVAIVTFANEHKKEALLISELLNY